MARLQAKLVKRANDGQPMTEHLKHEYFATMRSLHDALKFKDVSFDGVDAGPDAVALEGGENAGGEV